MNNKIAVLLRKRRKKTLQSCDIFADETEIRSQFGVLRTLVDHLDAVWLNYQNCPSKLPKGLETPVREGDVKSNDHTIAIPNNTARPITPCADFQSRHNIRSKREPRVFNLSSTRRSLRDSHRLSVSSKNPLTHPPTHPVFTPFVLQSIIPDIPHLPHQSNIPSWYLQFWVKCHSHHPLVNQKRSLKNPPTSKYHKLPHKLKWCIIDSEWLKLQTQFPHSVQGWFGPLSNPPRE